MTKGQKSIYDNMIDLVSTAPDKNFLVDETGSYSTLQVLSLAEHMAAAFIKADIMNGSIVLLKTKQNVPTVIAVFALKTIGATVILSDKDCKESSGLSAVSKEIHSAGLNLPVMATIEQTTKTGFSVISESGTVEFDMFGLKPSRVISPKPALDKPAFILADCDVYGSTGTVTLNEADIFSGKPDFSLTKGYKTKGRILVTSSLNSVIGLYSICRAALYDYTVYLTASKDARTLLSTVEKEKITGMCGPASLYVDMCEIAGEFDIFSLCTGFAGESRLSQKDREHVCDTLGIELFDI